MLQTDRSACHEAQSLHHSTCLTFSSRRQGRSIACEIAHSAACSTETAAAHQYEGGCGHWCGLVTQPLSVRSWTTPPPQSTDAGQRVQRCLAAVQGPVALLFAFPCVACRPLTCVSRGKRRPFTCLQACLQSASRSTEACATRSQPSPA